MKQHPRIAIVCDWLTTMGGAENVVLELHRLFPDAPIYTSVYDQARMSAFADADVRTTWMQKLLPASLRYRQALWPVLRAYAFRSLDLSSYDLIISSASAEAKAVRKRSDAVHICYCHTPIRYYYSHYNEFRREFDFGPLTFLLRPFIPLFVKWMRRKDLASIKGVDVFIANSNETKARIKRYYQRDSAVVFPPVATKKFALSNKLPRRSGFIVWGRQVPYKRFDLAILACNQLKLPLTIVGEGPDTARLKSLAGPTVTFTGRISDPELVRLAHASKAFFFPGEEDFGMAAAEALSAGLPVIAYKSGGSLDIIEEGVNGVFFDKKSLASIVDAIKRCNETAFSEHAILASAEKFSEARFDAALRNVVDEQSRSTLP